MSTPQPSNSGTPAAAAEREDRRAERRDLTGNAVTLQCDGMKFTIRLRDLSTSGLCGLTDAPLAPGQMVFMLLDNCEPVAVQVRWIRRALIGASFPEPLTPELVARLMQNQASKRKR
jgi:hypothetical protein